MNYRKDIDGIRAIAVLLVILNHAGFAFLPGGFIGVDVFFVLSGFLITSIILEKLKDKSFSYSWFFVRRIKRLLPVSFFVIAVTAVFFTFIMLPNDLVRLYQSIIWVVFYLGNFFFWREHGGYFGGDAEEAPLLHTWSLAVEEQYYFIWPLMLLVSIKMMGIKNSFYFFICLFLIFTCLSELGAQITLGASYYLLPTRFFELMAGSILSFVGLRSLQINNFFMNFISVIGFILIVGSSFFLNENIIFPGFNALYPVIGTIFLLISYKGVINKILCSRFFVFTGKISYSMYLWHWPIFTFLRYIAVELTLEIQLLAIALTYLLSYFSWRVIEQPFRYSTNVDFKKVLYNYFMLPGAFFAFISLIFIINEGFPNRFEVDILRMDEAFNSHVNESRKECHSPFRHSEIKPSNNCIEYFQNTSNADVFVWGDSHANHFVPFIHHLAKDAGLNAQDYTLDQCMPVAGMHWGSNFYKASKCKMRNDIAMNYIRQNSFKYVVMAASWPNSGTKKIFNQMSIVEDVSEKRKLLIGKLRETIKELELNQIKPVIFEDSPDLGGKSAKCPIKKAMFNSDIDCSVVRPENKFFKSVLKELKSEFDSLIIVSPRDVLCHEDNCLIELNGIPLYRDDDHLNEQASSYLGEVWLNSVNKNPFIN